MHIKEIINNKEKFIDILLIGDENIDMINKYLHIGKLFALYDNDLKSVCVIVELDDNSFELKNLATYPKYQNNGYASKLIDFLCANYKTKYKELILGTGENDKTLHFYKKRGFVEFKKIRNFFIKNYPHPIFENGVQLKDMIFLKKIL